MSPSVRPAWFALAALLTLAHAPSRSVIFPPGTQLPIRFLQRLESGRDSAGTRVLVQTMGALVSDSCVVVRPYVELAGTVTRSQGGGRFGRRGEFQIDEERDFLVRNLEAGGCADLLDYITLPGAVKEARTVAGQRVVTDARTALIRLRPCGGS